MKPPQIVKWWCESQPEVFEQWDERHRAQASVAGFQGATAIAADSACDEPDDVYIAENGDSYICIVCGGWIRARIVT